MSSSEKIKKVKRNLLAIGIGGGTISFLIVLGLYFFKFHKNLSDDHQVWGTFGDFVGGVLGPLLSFFAFIGLLWTIVLNYEELDRAKEESKNQEIQDKKNDLFRVVQIVHSECLDILRVTKNSYCFDCYDSPTVMVHILKEYDVESNKTNFDNWEIFRMTFANEIKDLENKLVMLKMLLIEFEGLTSNYYVSDYYKVFYGRYLDKLEKLKYLETDIAAYFRDVRHSYALQTNQA